MIVKVQVLRSILLRTVQVCVWCYYDEGANITPSFSSNLPSQEETNRLSWPKSTFREGTHFKQAFWRLLLLLYWRFPYFLTHAMCYYCYYSVTWLRDGPHLWTNSWSTSSTLLAGDWPLNMSEANTEKHSSSGPDPCSVLHWRKKCSVQIGKWSYSGGQLSEMTVSRVSSRDILGKSNLICISHKVSSPCWPVQVLGSGFRFVTSWPSSVGH